jgi:hypothetical protein
MTEKIYFIYDKETDSYRGGLQQEGYSTLMWADIDIEKAYAAQVYLESIFDSIEIGTYGSSMSQCRMVVRLKNQEDKDYFLMLTSNGI